MLKSEADRLTRVIVCTPKEEYYQVENLKAHNILEGANREKALKQHHRLKESLREFGAEVIDVPEFDGHPNSVFTRDTVMCTPQGYIQLLPGIKTREAEGRWMASVLDEIHEPCAGKIITPGTVDGGDVVLFDGVAFIGLTQRTNEEGIYQLSAYLISMGYETITIPLPDNILHLDKVLMPVSPGKLLVCVDIVPESAFRNFDTIKINYGKGATANIICLGDGELIVGNANKEAVNCLENEGLTLHLLDISEFAKGAGGPNCLIMPVERMTPVE